MEGKAADVCAVVAAVLLLAVEAAQWSMPSGDPVRTVLVLALALPACALAAIYLAFTERKHPLFVTLLAVVTFGFYALGTVYDVTEVDLWPWIHFVGIVAMAFVGLYARDWQRGLSWATGALFLAAFIWHFQAPTLQAAATQAFVEARRQWGLVNHGLVSASWILASVWLALLPWQARRAKAAQAAAQSL